MSAPERQIRPVRDEQPDRERPQQVPVAVAAPVVIELEDVWLEFDEPVLQGVSLRVHEGETLLVVGASGSGKSTLFKVVTRLLRPDRGYVRVFDEEITELSFEETLEIRRRIGLVFQYSALFDSLTIYDNVAYPLRENTDYDDERIEQIVRERLEFVDLDPDEVLDKLPGQLSGGMKKRVAIARATATEPEIMLYDEPTAGLDPLALDTILSLMQKEAELGVTTVIVTHDIRAGFRVASRVNLLRDGRIQFDGTPEEMQASDDPYIQAFLR